MSATCHETYRCDEGRHTRSDCRWILGNPKHPLLAIKAPLFRRRSVRCVDILPLLSHTIIINGSGPKGQLISRVSTPPLWLLGASTLPICALLPAPLFFHERCGLISKHMAHFRLNLAELLPYEPSSES